MKYRSFMGKATPFSRREQSSVYIEPYVCAYVCVYVCTIGLWYFLVMNNLRKSRSSPVSF